MTFSKQRAALEAGKRYTPAGVIAAVVLMLSGCGSSSNSAPATGPTATQAGPQLYMTPTIVGNPMGAPSVTEKVATFTIDDAQATFAQTIYGFGGSLSAFQVQYAGKFAASTPARGFLDLELTCSPASGDGCVTSSSTPKQGGWALELAGQAGGLAQIAGQTFVPLVAANTCPSMKTPQKFLFVTLPAFLNTGALASEQWNPQTETAYGSAEISASGTTVTLGNIAQFTLPSSGGSGAPVNPSTASVPGVCASTSYGNTVSIPGNVTATNPGITAEVNTPQALMGIGPSGLLVEDNGTSTVGPTIKPPYYENALGAGTGAIGLPEAASAVNTGSLVGAQYLGFFYGAGNSAADQNWSSAPVSFGFASQPSSCTSVAPQTSTIIYGGDFSGGNPGASTTGYGNCDFAIDLGTQDAATNGLYSAATVYVGSSFGANTTGKTYSFPAVAIAGQLNGKYAIFLIGMDSTGTPNQPWGIYLLQSN